MSGRLFRRGTVVRIAFDPAVGSEPNKSRPAVIVSNDGIARAAGVAGRGLITVVPFSTKLAKRYSTQVFVSAAESGLPQDSKAKAEEIRSVSPQRVLEVIGLVPEERMAEIDEALRLHLAL